MTQSVHVPVTKEIWEWVFTVRRVDQLDKKHLSIIQTWLSNSGKPNSKQLQPTVLQLVQLSKKLDIPFGYFFLSKPPSDLPPVVEHRTIKNKEINNPSQELLETISTAELIQSWAHQDAIRNGFDPLPFVGMYHAQDAKSPGIVKKISKKISSLLSLDSRGNQYLPDNWGNDPTFIFNKLRDLLTGIGVIVIMNGVVGNNTHRPLNPQEFRAFALIDDQTPLIFINKADKSPYARLFSLIHEFVHILFGNEELYDAKDLPSTSVSITRNATSELEEVCNKAASEFLMPEKAFSLFLKNNHIEDQYPFPVSKSSFLVRAYKDGFINKQELDDALQQAEKMMNKQRLNKKSGGDFYKTQRSRFGSVLLKQIKRSVLEGTTSYLDAYRMTGTNRLTYEKLMQEI